MPPWVGYNEEEMLKEQITELSTVFKIKSYLSKKINRRSVNKVNN